MTISETPFIGIAVPVEFSPISKAYWQTDSSVKEIALRFSINSGKKVTKRAGHARLLGISCKDCSKEIIVNNRGHALSEIAKFNKTPIGSRVQCIPCFHIDRKKRLKSAQQERKEKRPVTRKVAVQRSTKKIDRPSVQNKEEFYASWEWRTLRMEVIKEFGRACQCCGAQPGMKYASGEPVRVVVDHIKPISKFWDLRLQRSNLQVLCDECNQGKGNWDETDFRPAPASDEWVIEEGGISPAILDQLSGGTIQ